MNSIPVIDLFAGPGGLGEGFSAFKDKAGNNPFKISLSIEKDELAHQTLKLRSFFRQFSNRDIPEEYYQYLKKEITREELFKKYPDEASAASEEAWLAELGKMPHGEVKQRIRKALASSRSWVLIGGPPCQAYSVVGRVRMKKKDPEKFENDKRHFLYKEYLRIIRDHRPPVFIMENVTGILSSKTNGKHIFTQILEDLKCPINAFKKKKRPLEEIKNRNKYEIYSLVKIKSETDPHENKDFVIYSEKYGIPQRRHRVILLGIRKDLIIKPAQLAQCAKKIKMWDVINDLPKLRSGLTDTFDSIENWKRLLVGIPDFEWFKDKMDDKVFVDRLKMRLSNLNGCLNSGNDYVPHKKWPKWHKGWFIDSKFKGICNHVSRRHIKRDLLRYFYAACFAKKLKKSPEIKDFPKNIWPEHKNISKASEGIMFSDRFRVQLKNKPSTTITSHISKDGHYYIHPDPIQCRSLTVREAARLQTFPDNYLFEGPRTSQYQQVGNAVPPLLARQIAGIVSDLFERLDEHGQAH